jgi:eukaryotic-like serine/threonine-protein kinase
MTAIADRTDFLRMLQMSNLLAAERLQSVATVMDDAPPDASTLAEKLIQTGDITRFQAKQLLAGKHKGFLLGPYKILDQIGKGGMGTVFLAEHSGVNKKLALKVLARELSEDKAAIERFQREARAASALSHPNIVRVHHVGQTGENRYIVMEYVNGATLEQILDRKGPFTVSQAARIAMQAAAGLHHAHEKGFVHRDIKPENLMLTKEGLVKILDMGLTKSNSQEDNLTGTLNPTLILGTIDYLSPEQAMQGPLDARSDIYSLGATLFTLITGHSPYEGVPPRQKLMQHQCGAVPNLSEFHSEVPQELAAIVTQMMAKKPADRMNTMAEVIERLKPFAELDSDDPSAAVSLPSGMTSVLMTGISRSMTPTVRNAEASTQTAPVNTGTGRPNTAISGIIVAPSTILTTAQLAKPADATPAAKPTTAAVSKKNQTAVWFSVGVGIAIIAAVIVFILTRPS